jgi:hypothetical protein
MKYALLIYSAPGTGERIPPSQWISAEFCIPVELTQ